MIPCCSVSLFRLKFRASTERTARRPPFFRMTVSLRISAMGRKRCAAALGFPFRCRTVSGASPPVVSCFFLGIVLCGGRLLCCVSDCYEFLLFFLFLYGSLLPGNRLSCHRAAVEHTAQFMDFVILFLRV